MKKLLTLFAVILFVVACNAQPNTYTTYEAGIVNPVEGKTYLFFKEIKTDTTLTASLKDSMDYLDPNVSGLIQPLTNYRTVGDTLFGRYSVKDVEEKRFVKGGLVQVDNNSTKYSSMTVTYWMPLDSLEKRPGFFMRKVK